MILEGLKKGTRTVQGPEKLLIDGKPCYNLL